MKATLDITKPTPAPPNGASTKPIPQAGAELLDWDIQIELPPRRPQGSIEVRLARGGRSRPIPITHFDTD